MRAHELLIERVINAISDAQKQKYVNQVWDILQKSYAKIGGFKSAASPDELIADSGLWKLVRRGGEITAASVYKDRFGRKAIASGTDGTDQGKKDYMMLTGSDIQLGRSWAEVSGAPERIMAKLGADAIPSEYASLLTGKEILDYNPDGFHYTRLIAGKPHEKIIYGTATLNSEDLNLLKKLGIELNKIPKNVKISG